MSSYRKGIILAGGRGKRLSPLTNVISKQILPIYDKPMIYYPLSTLMLSGIKEILIICRSQDLELYKSLLGDGRNLGISIEYAIQESPDGIAQAFIIGKNFIGNSPSALILGDNLFYGDKLSIQLQDASKKKETNLFVCRVKDPERYGVVNFDSKLKVLEIKEKPLNPVSNYVVTGLYFYDHTVTELVKYIKPSERGELEITDLNNLYIKENNLKVNILGRGVAWLDAGTFDSLFDAGLFIRTIENRQGFKIGCPEEIAWRMGWIDSNQLKELARNYMANNYGKYLMSLEP